MASPVSQRIWITAVASLANSPPPPFRELGLPVKFPEKRIFLIKDFNIRELVDFLRSHIVSNNSKNLKTFSVCMSAEKTIWLVHV